MSADPNQDEPKAAPVGDGPVSSADASGVIPIEVEPPDAPADAAPDPVPNPVSELEAKLAASEKEKKDNWDRYLRSAADVENLRKRQKREVEDARFEMKGKVLKEVLPVVDNLERAIEHAGAGSEEDPKLKPLIEGVQLVLRQLVTAFERLDVQAIDAMGQPFDPNLHEAISQQESEAPPGSVIQVLQRGYKSGDRLLRPTLVVVAKPKAAAE